MGALRSPTRSPAHQSLDHDVRMDPRPCWKRSKLHTFRLPDDARWTQLHEFHSVATIFNQ
eukprot:6364957-Amphidinium_carterae.1